MLAIRPATSGEAGEMWDTRAPGSAPGRTLVTPSAQSQIMMTVNIIPGIQSSHHTNDNMEIRNLNPQTLRCSMAQPTTRTLFSGIFHSVTSQMVLQHLVPF